MFSKFVPSYYATSLYDVEIEFFHKIGIKYILIDLDNTLESYRVSTASPQAQALIASLKQSGYKLWIISNNHGERVSKYADSLQVPFLSGARKPFAGRIWGLMKKESITPSETLLIGDQLLTDVRAAHRLGIRSLLTEKIVKEDQWTTRFNRLIDRPIRHYLQCHHRLPDWRKYNE